MFSSFPEKQRYDLPFYGDLWQEPAMGQQLQLQPQEDFPRFRSMRIRNTIPVSSAVSAMPTMIVPAFSTIH